MLEHFILNKEVGGKNPLGFKLWDNAAVADKPHKLLVESSNLSPATIKIKTGDRVS